MAGAASLAGDSPARLVAAGGAIISAAVLADSAIEHYRGSFRDPFMVAPLAAAATTLAMNVRRFVNDQDVSPTGPDRAAVVVGCVGLGFHLWNVAKRPGGFGILNLFYGAPIGAPAALVLAGLCGISASSLLSRGENEFSPLPGSARVIAGAAAFGLIGTAGEAGLLHFRGAFHNPAMWAPVTLPPVAAIALARDAVTAEPQASTTVLLGATAALGLVGAAFHVWGVHRNMGGWRNWRQNLLAGPPIPAPPAFTGLALVGLAAAMLMRRGRD